MQKRKLESIDGGKKTFHERDLEHIIPKNSNQRYALEEFMCGQNLSMIGSAGTGKTFLAVYMGIKEALNKESPIENVTIVRSAVPVRDIGFLPGTEDEKTEIYEQPYKAICDELFDYSKSYENLKKQGKIRFVTTSYTRGITLKNSVVVVDECQSLTAHELDTVITRLGTHSKLILCGDAMQTDLVRSRDRSGFGNVMAILKTMHEFSFVEFQEDDIVRCSLVKNYIIKRNRMGLEI